MIRLLGGREQWRHDEHNGFLDIPRLAKCNRGSIMVHRS